MKNMWYSLPKAELHMHVEGALEPELLLAFAERNKVSIPYTTIEQVKASYQFCNLQSFLDLYYQAQQVLRTAQDFYELLLWYGIKSRTQGVRHAEVFFEVQSYQGCSIEAMVEGLLAARDELLAHHDISIYVILCFLRDHSEQSACEALRAVRPYRDQIVAVGLASAEKGHPPVLFKRVFEQARIEGYHVVAHAGEEAGPGYVWQAIRDLHVERIDHGIHSMDDPRLVEFIASHSIPVTVCPISNCALQVVPDLEQHPVGRMLRAGLAVSLHSDDPAYFGGYCGDVYAAVHKAGLLSANELVQCAQNSFKGSFLPASDQQRYLSLIDQWILESCMSNCRF